MSGYRSLLAFWVGGAGTYAAPPPAAKSDVYTKLGPGGYPISIVQPPLVQVWNETIQLAETRSRVLYGELVKTVSETVRAVEAIVRSSALDVTRVVSETVRLSENRLAFVFAEVTRIVNEAIWAEEADTPWTPKVLSGVNLLAWLDAADASTITVTGSGVSQWLDKSGNARHARQTDDAHRPAYTAGKVTFDSVRLLDLDAFTAYPATYDYLVVGKPYDPISGAFGFRVALQTGADHYPLIMNSSNSAGVYNAGGFVAGLPWTPYNIGMAYVSLSDVAAVTLSRDGGSPVPLLASFGETGRVVALGNRYNFAMPWGEINEVIMVPYGASLDTRQKLEGYAAWKWGFASLLPVGHPYKIAAPTVAGLGIVKAMLLNRMVSEAERLVESLLRVRALIRTTASPETMSVRESGAGGRVRSRVIDEVVDIVSKVPLFTRGASFVVNETVRLVEGLFFARAMLRPVNEALELVESPDLSIGKTRTVSEGARVFERGGEGVPPNLSGLVVWLDAAALGLADGAPVTTWPNLGSGPTPSWVGSPPATYRAGALNDQGVVRFSALQAFLRSTFALTKDYTVLYVSRMVGPGVGRVFSTIETTNHSVGYSPSGYDTFVDGAVIQAPTPYILPTPWRLYSVDGRSLPSYRSRLFINGVFYVNGTNTAGGLGGGAWGLSGSLASGTAETSDAEVAEIMIYDHMLSNAERLAVEHYLNSKWFPTGAGGPLVVRAMTRLLSEVVSIVEQLTPAKQIVQFFSETVRSITAVVESLGRSVTYNEAESIGDTSVRARGLARLRGEFVRPIEAKVTARGRVQAVSETLHLPEVFNFFTSIPSLVCSAIKLYAMFAGSAQIAPLVMGSTMINPEIGGGLASLNPAVTGETGIAPALNAERTKIDPAVEGQLKIEECC